MREFSKLDEWSLWVPDVDSERKSYAEGDDTALSMELRFMTKGDRDKYQRLSEKFRKQTGSASMADKKAARQLFVDNVRDIRNYVIDGEPITEGGDLYDVEGDDLMIMKITEALFQRSSLEAGLAKKLRSPSVSSTEPAARKEPGSVVDATPRSAPTIQATNQSRAI